MRSKAEEVAGRQNRFYSRSRKQRSLIAGHLKIKLQKEVGFTIKLKLALIVILLVTGLVVGMNSAVRAEELAVATVSMQEVFMVHPAVEQAQEELQAKQMEMMAEMEELDEEEAAMMREQLQMELQQLQQELLEAAVAEVRADIESIADELGFDVVLEPEGIISGEELLATEDITEEVLEEFNGEPEVTPGF